MNMHGQKLLSFVLKSVNIGVCAFLVHPCAKKVMRLSIHTAVLKKGKTF